VELFIVTSRDDAQLSKSFWVQLPNILFYPE
jgi:hypothetical protein